MKALVALLVLVALAGCSSPQTIPGTYRPTSTNGLPVTINGQEWEFTR